MDWTRAMALLACAGALYSLYLGIVEVNRVRAALDATRDLLRRESETAQRALAQWTEAQQNAAELAIEVTSLRESLANAEPDARPFIRQREEDMGVVAAERDRLSAEVASLRHGINHPYGGIAGCDRCAAERIDDDPADGRHSE